MATLTYAQVASVLKCEPDTGCLYWLPRPLSMFTTHNAFATWNTRYAGKPALTGMTPAGYCTGRIFNKCFYAHRVIWLLETGEWPKDQIDHINGDRSDNRISNLRQVSNAENARNMKRRKNKPDGVTGVYWDKLTQKWRAQICDSGRRIHIGLFDDMETAAAARMAKQTELGFHASHGSAPVSS